MRLNVDRDNASGATHLYERAGMRLRRRWLVVAKTVTSASMVTQGIGRPDHPRPPRRTTSRYSCACETFTSQRMPNRSVSIPKVSPHVASVSGISTVPPSASLSK